MNTFGCVKNTIRLRSGRYFDFSEPAPDQFELSDIAGALSKICRFGGQIDRFYSVAEHCFHCQEQAMRDGATLEVQVAALMHDAAEAFVGDVVKPLKIMLAEYPEIEERVEQAIAERFGIEFYSTRDAIREIDHAMLIAERREFFSPDQVEWAGENSVRVLNPWFEAWPPQQAEAKFLSRARELGITD